MDYTAEELEDLEQLRLRREQIRAWADRILEAGRNLPIPETEAGLTRMTRLATTTDRMMVQLYTPPRKRPAARKPTAAKSRPVRSKELDDINTMLADVWDASHAIVGGQPLPPRRPLKTVAPEPSADGHDEGASEPGVAASSALIKPVPGPVPVSAPANPSVEDENIAFADNVTRLHAQVNRVWPDGTAFDAQTADWHGHAAAGAAFPVRGNDDDAYLTAICAEMLRRINAITAHAARRDGKWPDGVAFATQPDRNLYAVSRNCGSGNRRPAIDEASGPPDLPWWIIRHRNPPS